MTCQRLDDRCDMSLITSVMPIFWLRHIYHSDLLQCIYLLSLDSTILHALCLAGYMWLFTDIMMLAGVCSDYNIMISSCLYYTLIMMLRQLTCLCRCFDYNVMILIIYMNVLCLCNYHAVVVIRFIYFMTQTHSW